MSRNQHFSHDFFFSFFFLFFFSSPFLIFLFLSFCCSFWPSTGLAPSLRISEKALINEKAHNYHGVWVVEGNIILSFSPVFLSIFMYISRLIYPITLIWVTMERSFPLAEFDHKWWLVEQRPMLNVGPKITKLYTHEIYRTLILFTAPYMKTGNVNKSLHNTVKTSEGQKMKPANPNALLPAGPIFP